MDELAKALAKQLLGGAWRLEDQPLRPGVSGQAWLFRARDERTDEPVVIKVFKPDRIIDFEREVAALRKLSEGSCERNATFRDHGTVTHAKRTLPFVVMDFVEGVPLDELLAAGLLDLDERLEALAQIAEGLAELHRLFIVHRDLKPANVIVRFVDADAVRPAEALHLKLVDFGISTVLDSDIDTHMTTFKGTPLYMAPEQQDKRSEVALSTDIYAFGLLARDLLMGKGRTKAISADRALADIHDALERGSHPRRRSLCDVFRESLARDPAERLPNGEELAARMRAALPDPEVSPMHPKVRALRHWHRRTVVAGVPLDAQRALTHLAEWAMRFCGTVILAGLSEDRRTLALERLARGEPYHDVVEDVRSGAPLPAPAARAARDFWSLRVADAEHIKLVDPDAPRDVPVDATLFPRSLLENALESAASGDSDERWFWVRALVEALAGSPLFMGFTLGRAAGSADAPRMFVRLAQEHEHPWPFAAGEAPGPVEPLLVKVSPTGRPDARVAPLRLAPFARLGDDGVDLLFFTGSPSAAPRFTTPLGVEALPVPQGWPFASSHGMPPSIPRTGQTGSDPPRSFSVMLACAAPPVLELVGPAWTYLLTGAGEWFALGPHGDVHPLHARLAPCAVGALDPQGRLVVAAYEPMLARTAQPDWEYILRDAPVLALAGVPRGVVSADLTGKIQLFGNGSEPVAPLAAGEPIVDVIGAGSNAIAAISAAGSLWTCRWPAEASAVPVHVDTMPVGRPSALFSPVDERLAGVWSTERAALLDIETSRFGAISPPFPAGIRQVRALRGPRGGYGLLTDDGELWTLDASLVQAHRARLPHRGDRVTGMRALAGGKLIAWTQNGELFALGPERTLRRIAGDGVCLAFEPPAKQGLVVVRWKPPEGAQIQCQNEPKQEALP